MPWEDWRPGEDEHTSAWVRATAPSGRADYEGVVGWSGELGYGVRRPERGQSAPPPGAGDQEQGEHGAHAEGDDDAHGGGHH
jgi:NADH-quinone oxidoreductase subunit I